MRRDVTLAVLVCALLLLGVAAGGTVPARQEPLLVQPPASAAPAPALSGEFVYFPAQYVNQAVESAEDIPTF